VYLGQDTLRDDAVRQNFETWAKNGKSGRAKLYMQISHPGRQVFAAQGTQPVSASATKVKMDAPGTANMFDTARALTGDEILGLIKRFADTAAAAERAGFDGVQVHAAHGYLVAQFLSPLTNLREDDWGGPLENRSKFLLEIIRAIRDRVEPGFGVGVKLNSADFQKGGFDFGDARQVVEWLSGEAVDFVELSGGSYESAAMMGASDDPRTQSTRAREMYFIEFAKDIKGSSDIPIMVTGGVTKKETATAALAEGDIDMVGIARAMAFDPELPNHWQNGSDQPVAIPMPGWKSKAFASMATMAMTKAQLYRMGDGKPLFKKQNAFLATIKQQMRTGQQTKRYKKWLESLGPKT